MERLDENETLLCLFGGDEKNVVPMCGFSPGAWAGQELMLQNLWRYGLTGADMGAMLGRSVSTGARCAGDPQRMYEHLGKSSRVNRK